MWSQFSLVLHCVFVIFLVKLSNQVTSVSLKSFDKVITCSNMVEALFGIYGLILCNTEEVFVFENSNESTQILIMCIKMLAFVSLSTITIFAFQNLSNLLKLVSQSLFGCQPCKRVKKSNKEIKLTIWLKRHKKKHIHNKDSVDTCAICLGDFSLDGKDFLKSPQLVAQLDCSQQHIFHFECIKNWVEKNDICPMCR
jgi:hypothetical protein